MQWFVRYRTEYPDGFRMGMTLCTSRVDAMEWVTHAYQETSAISEIEVHHGPKLLGVWTRNRTGQFIRKVTHDRSKSEIPANFYPVSGSA